jgi:hypothetical protein
MNVGVVLSYLSATPALPLQDEMLASVDSSVGFHWLTVSVWVWRHPGFGWLLATGYSSLIPEMLALGAWLSWHGQIQRIQEFFWIVCLTSLFTCMLSAVVPAAGAFAYYGMPERSGWMHDLELLRGGSNLHFALADLTGIVTFPSFHTVVALLVIHAVRGTGAVGLLFMVWNGIMLFSIPPFGGHYLADMIGGGVVLAVSIGIFRCAVRVNRRRDILVV